MPRTLIFMESQSSSRPGLVASFKVLAAWDSHDRKPMLTEKNIPVSNNKHYCGIRYVWGFCFLISTLLLLGIVRLAVALIVTDAHLASCWLKMAFACG